MGEGALSINPSTVCSPAVNRMETRNFMARVSGHLSDDTVYQMDDDDLMQKIRYLMDLKEELQNKIRVEAMEADAWLQVLGCTSAKEVEDLASSLPSTVKVMREQQSLLRDHYKLSAELLAFILLDGITAYQTNEGDILIKFLQLPSKTKYSDLLMLLSTGDDNKYRVRHHNLPNVVPVAKLEEEYLKDVPERDDPTERLKKFVTVITQYTRALHSRQEQIFTLEKAELLTKTQVYHNSSCTFITFLLEVKEKHDQKGSMFEFSLTYHPLDILPYKVQVDHIDGDVPRSHIVEVMEDMVLEMKSEPFPQVIYSMLGSNSSDQGISQETTESNSSGDTILF